jgi:hypothetical protein
VSVSLLACATQIFGMSKARLGPLLVILPLLGLAISFSPRRAFATTDREGCVAECHARCDEEDAQHKGCLDMSGMAEDSCHSDCEHAAC